MHAEMQKVSATGIGFSAPVNRLEKSTKSILSTRNLSPSRKGNVSMRNNVGI